MKTSVWFFLILVAAAVAQAVELTAEEIMSRVAENQERSLDARKNWTYQQSVLTRLNRTNGKLAREEDKEYFVAPAPKGIDKKLVRFSGKYERKGQFVAYDEPGHSYKGMDIDGELADELADELMSDSGGKDGLSPGMFPLSASEQNKYNFTLHGKERYRDEDVYKIEFTPKSRHFDEGDSMWAGEALIHTAEFQPVLITSYQAKNVPMAIRTLLGTNIKQVGFKVQYKKIDEGIWLPVSCGGEFTLRALFFYGRKISISMNNTAFQKTDVQSRVLEYLPIAQQ